MELFIRIIMKTNGIEGATVAKGWKNVARQSERQLGAFIFLFILEFRTQPSLLSRNHTELRNRIIHQGYFPTEKECIAYGTAVLCFIRDTIKLLHDSEVCVWRTQVDSRRPGRDQSRTMFGGG